MRINFTLTYLPCTLLYCLLVVTSCRQQPDLPIPKELTWQEKTTNSQWCRTDTTGCVKFTAKYVIFNGDSSLARQLNSDLDQFSARLLEIEPEEKALTPDSVGSKLVQEYQDAISNATTSSDWEVDYKTKVVFKNEKVITLDRDVYTYMGGAHPGNYRQITSYDLLTGRALTATDLVQDSVGLSKLLEARFKAEKGVGPETNLSELVFPEASPLPLPTNLALVEAGILFFYNDYEVAPHAIGSTEIMLTWNELGALVKENKWK
jgi:Deacetylase PdaC/Protein of unknown function (DUF3298)